MLNDIAALTTNPILVLIADEDKGLQFFLSYYFLHGIPLVKSLVLIYIEHFMGNTKSINGLKVEQQIV